MRFTTPCFVRVEDAAAMRKLDIWLDKIGYDWKIDPKSEIKEGRHHILNEDYVAKSLTVVCRRKTRMWTIHCASKRANDCGTDVELFKALAAMNDENAYMQYFVYRPKGYMSHISTLGGWWLCTEQRWIDWAKPRFLNSMVFARKATAEEIIEHFNNRVK